MSHPLARRYSTISLVALSAVLAVSTALAQPASEEAGADAEAAAPQAPAAAQAPAGEFTAKFEEWKTALKELRTLQRDVLTATDDEIPEIKRSWDTWVGKAEQLLPQLRTTGLQAYTAAPGQDRELERFLLKLLDDDIQHDRYERAAELSQGLLDNGCDVKRVCDAAGVAAFATNDFDQAEIYLQQAEDAGVLSETGRNFKGLVPEYKEYWAEEQQIRQKESAADDLPRVKITTNRGEMEIELFENEAPDTVGNFINLAEKGFYDGLDFHRVLPGFMAQGGCPLGTGGGGPGYNIFCECYGDNYRKHFRGTLSMAHAGRDSGGSQFFITFVPTAHLNGKHTAFGRVIKGLDVLDDIRRIDPESQDQQPTPDQIVKMEVLRKRPDREYVPNKVE